MDAIATDYLIGELRRLRTVTGLTQERFASRIHYSPQHVSAVERGERPALPDYLGVVDREFGTRLTFFHEHWVQGEPVPEWFRPLAEVERQAATLRYYEHAVVPGVFQTPEYADAILNAGLLAPRQVEEYLQIRLSRQSVIFDRDVPPVVTAIIDEAALRRGPQDILKAQWERLLDVGLRPRTYIHVIPDRVGFHAGLPGPFVLATVRGETVGFVDDQLTGRCIYDAAQATTLGQAWQAIAGVALPCDQSRDLIIKLVEES